MGHPWVSCNRCHDCRWEVDGRYKTYPYAWPADREPLAVGDIVELPPPMSAEDRELYGDKPWQAEVTRLGTYYRDWLAEVVRVVRRAPSHDPG